MLFCSPILRSFRGLFVCLAAIAFHGAVVYLELHTYMYYNWCLQQKQLNRCFKLEEKYNLIT